MSHFVCNIHLYYVQWKCHEELNEVHVMDEPIRISKKFSGKKKTKHQENVRCRRNCVKHWNREGQQSTYCCMQICRRCSWLHFARWHRWSNIIICNNVVSCWVYSVWSRTYVCTAVTAGRLYHYREFPITLLRLLKIRNSAIEIIFQ